MDRLGTIDLVAAVQRQDWNYVSNALGDLPGSVRLNTQRRALQLLDCQGFVRGQIGLSDKGMAALD